WPLAVTTTGWFPTPWSCRATWVAAPAGSSTSWRSATGVSPAVPRALTLRLASTPVTLTTVSTLDAVAGAATGMNQRSAAVRAPLRGPAARLRGRRRGGLAGEVGHPLGDDRLVGLGADDDAVHAGRPVLAGRDPDFDPLMGGNGVLERDRAARRRIGGEDGDV